ncbi:hypothetical protein ESZ53_01490 [Salinibacterium sp. UTAS2018]|uniref:hypothetical protein n=1 Tax=Salinibacterium sp. UTAS2018 TaxID=2508880 RepID=UPI0010095BC6|nr:hypothetical protein [Salinibacterium sp. UTAS2018]QAV69230.1 hypothetical protein ESZ53_01490 [Salinibacterium sp. UTAS2018]
MTEVATRLGGVKRRVESLPTPPGNSVLGRIDALTTPFNTSEMVQMYLAVAIDNLWTLHRYVRKVKEIPMVAAYSLIRSAVESTSYGIWILNGYGNDVRAQRSLRVTLNDFQQHAALQNAFGSYEFDVPDLEQMIRDANTKLRGLQTEAIDDQLQSTGIINAVDGFVGERRFFSGIQVWRATSGLSHASQLALSVLLERAPDGTRTSRMTFVAGFALTAIENIEHLLDRVVELSQPFPTKRSESVRSD